ncbi:hypothetical protein [Rhizobium sp. RU36D]|uniref:hypothetical protein n=1 Tax=Rhizobium sp. RU36D TaxID=1907415 RepID=UPI0009D7FD53|nr:hypothetical protein [Rhizobium sp. RU36D]SMD16344.1 hypothetical protein SAMN05880593_12952 [Rhizobium sp. RU36D]
MTITAPLIDAAYVIRRLNDAKALIDTGGGFYAPDGDAIQAQQDCADAIGEIRKDGLTSSTVELAAAVISQAADFARLDGEQAALIAWASQIRNAA